MKHIYTPECSNLLLSQNLERISFLCYLFISPENWWIITVHTILSCGGVYIFHHVTVDGRIKTESDSGSLPTPLFVMSSLCLSTHANCILAIALKLKHSLCFIIHMILLLICFSIDSSCRVFASSKLLLGQLKTCWKL